MQQSEGRAAHKLQEERYREAKATLDAQNAKSANQARAARRKGIQANEDNDANLRREAENTKELKREWRAAADARRQAHLDKAKATKDAIGEAKANAARKKAEWMERKRASAREEKPNDSVATQALANEVARNAATRRKVYARRYVSIQAVAELDSTDTFRKLYKL